MLRFQKMMQVILIVLLTQAGLLLLVAPGGQGPDFSMAAWAVVLGLLLCLLLGLQVLSRMGLSFPSQLGPSGSLSVLSLLYFPMILVNGLGLVLLCRADRLLAAPLDQFFAESFLASSVLLLGLDIVLLAPGDSGWLQGHLLRSREMQGLLLGLLLFALFKNPCAIFCFLVYLGLGLGTAQLLRQRGQELDFSLLAHLIRNLLVLLLLPFCF